MGSSWTRAQIHVSCIVRLTLNHCTTWGVPKFYNFKALNFNLKKKQNLVDLVNITAYGEDLHDQKVVREPDVRLCGQGSSKGPEVSNKEAHQQFHIFLLTELFFT